MKRMEWVDSDGRRYIQYVSTPEDFADDDQADEHVDVEASG